MWKKISLTLCLIASMASYATPSKTGNKQVTKTHAKHVSENLYCLGNISAYQQVLMVALLPDQNELEVNGDSHAITSHREDKDSRMLYTQSYLTDDSKLVYLALIHVFKGVGKGIYLVQYKSVTDDPEMVVLLHCHRYKG